MLQRGPRTRRSLVTVLFTDIVGSTVRAAELGDRQWRELLARHHTIVRRDLRKHGGREVDTAGDGFLSVFESPAAAVLCACDIRDDVRQIGIEIRAGLHTGEIEAEGEKVTGIAVHIAARVLAAAGPSEVLVSSTVRDIVAGSDLSFEDRGTHELKGVPGEWHLFAADRTSRPELAAAPPEPPTPRRRPRTAYLVAAVAALAILAVSGAVFLAGQSPAATPGATASATPLAVGPNRLVAIDLATGQLVQSVVVGAGPGPVVSDGAALWVGNIQNHTVSRVLAADGTEQDLGGNFGTPTGMAFGAGYVWIVDGIAGELSVVDPGNPTTVARAIPSVGGDGVAVATDAAWITDETAALLWRVDAATLLRGNAAMELGASLSSPSALAIDGHFAWIVDGSAPRVVRVDLTGAEAPRELALGVQPEQIVAGLGYIWVSSLSADSVIRIDPQSLDKSTIEVGNGPAAMAVAQDHIWVALREARAVVSVGIDRSVGQPVNVVEVPSGLSVEAGRLWVALEAAP